MKQTEPRLAICFFGITRSLTQTVNSIQNNVITPAKKQGNVRIYSHFFLQNQIYNPRSGELGSYDLNEHHLLNSDWIRLEDPDLCLNDWNFQELCSFGDYWDDDFRSLRNLLHQLHSLRQVTLAALEDGMHNCVFCRPDLFFHNSMEKVIRRALRARDDRVQLPYWQGFNGYNDRFAVCTGSRAVNSYGCRIELANQYCREVGPLHSENLVRFALQSAEVDVRFIGTRASRVRIDGSIKHENFQRPKIREIRKRFGVLRRRVFGLTVD